MLSCAFLAVEIWEGQWGEEKIYRRWGGGKMRWDQMVRLPESTPHPGGRQPATSEMRCVHLNSTEGPEFWLAVGVSAWVSGLNWDGSDHQSPSSDPQAHKSSGIESGRSAWETLQKQTSQIFRPEVKEPICLLQAWNERKSACLLFLFYKCVLLLNYFWACPFHKKWKAPGRGTEQGYFSFKIWKTM